MKPLQQNSGSVPPISVVVASLSAEALLSDCIRSIETQLGRGELIVATSSPPEVVGRLETLHPGVRFVRGPATASIFDLRTLGIEQARGRLVALTEGHVTVSSRWVASLLEAHAEGHCVMGGPVENGNVAKAYDWALFFCEYGLYMPPCGRGSTDELSGINVAYDRETLHGCAPVWRDAMRENEVHDWLTSRQHRLWLVPDSTVTSHLDMALFPATGHLYSGGRHYARYRKSRETGGQGLLRLLAAPLLPVVLLSRIVGRVASRRPERLTRVVVALPYLLLLIGAWSAGEVMGCLSCCGVERATCE